MSEPRREPASFRDPANRVLHSGGRVLRSLDADASEAWRALEAAPFFRRAMDEGRVVRTTVAPDDLSAAGLGALVLEHERIPFVSYPYEWSFEMLRDAAALHLALLAEALDAGFTMKDGYSYNVQFRGPTPVFIDVGSFEPNAGGPWVGYRQFCQTMLYPLMLEAYAGVPFQDWLRGDLEGIEPTEMRRLLGGRRRFAKGVVRHVFLHSLAERRVQEDSEQVRRDLGRAGFGTELAKAVVKNLRGIVDRIRSPRSESAWNDYRSTCSYSDADREAKERFVDEVVGARQPRLTWDLGANDGAYARIAARASEYVVAADVDAVTVDSMYRALRRDGVRNVVPLVIDLMDPSPGRGWRGVERAAFVDRGSPDVVLALAVVHHLAIGANVPLGEVVDWFRSIGGTLVVEFVHPEDPMTRRLLANKRAGLFPDYRVDAFERELGRHYEVVRRLELPAGTRTLYHAEPR